MYHSTACEFNIYQSTFLGGASGVAIHLTIKACFKNFGLSKSLNDHGGFAKKQSHGQTRQKDLRQNRVAEADFCKDEPGSYFFKVRLGNPH